MLSDKIDIAKELQLIDIELKKLVLRIKAMRQEVSGDTPPQYSPTFDKLYKNTIHACAERDRLIASGKYPGLQMGYEGVDGWNFQSPRFWSGGNFSSLRWNMEVDVQPWQLRTFEEQYSGNKIQAARAMIDAIEKDPDVMIEVNTGNAWCRLSAIVYLDYVIRPVPEGWANGHSRSLSNFRWLDGGK